MNMWTEIHTAMLVGREGTVRAAAEKLGIHRATVSRHIDTLEENLETKLFLRHQHGYTPTPAGRQLMQAAEKADLAITDFHSFLKTTAHDLVGRLTVSAVSKAAPLIRSATKQYCDAHPGVKVRFNPTVEMPKLELFGSHISVRACKKPDHPDYVVLPFYRFSIGLYAHRSYVDAYGLPKDLGELCRHRFIGASEISDEFDVPSKYGDFIREENIVLETNDPSVVLDSILSGIGIGFASKSEAAEQDDLIEILAPQEPIIAQVWIITHMDVHRTRLIQEFISCLKSCAPKADTPIPFSAVRSTTPSSVINAHVDGPAEFRDAS